MSTPVVDERRARRAERARLADVLWPLDVELTFNITKPTRWRWERNGRLPARDVNVAGKTGWKRTTIEAAINAA